MPAMQNGKNFNIALSHAVSDFFWREALVFSELMARLFVWKPVFVQGWQYSISVSSPPTITAAAPGRRKQPTV